MLAVMAEKQGVDSTCMWFHKQALIVLLTVIAVPLMFLRGLQTIALSGIAYIYTIQFMSLTVNGVAMTYG